MEHLIAPHGGALCKLLVDDDQAETLKQESGEFLNVNLSQRHICDLELLLCGGLSPLRGFMDQASYESVISQMRLPDGSLWSIPITYDVPAGVAAKIEPGRRLALCDGEGFMVAALTVSDKWQPDKQREERRYTAPLRWPIPACVT